MHFGCERTRQAVEVILGISAANLTLEDLEGAFVHLRRCRSCKESLSTEDYRTFTSRVLLERD